MLKVIWRYLPTAIRILSALHAASSETSKGGKRITTEEILDIVRAEGFTIIDR